MQVSSKQTPCPCCGRVRTNHCRFNLDGSYPIVLCHDGVSSGPPPNLQIGETLDFAGIKWALVGKGKGHSGNSHEFRPHREREQWGDWTPSADLLQMQQARRSLAIHSIDRFFERFQQAWDVKDFHSLPMPALRQAFDLIYAVEQEGLALARSIQTIWREHPDLRDRHKSRFEAYLKNLRYQRQDVDDFRQHYLGEVI